MILETVRWLGFIRFASERDRVCAEDIKLLPAVGLMAFAVADPKRIMRRMNLLAPIVPLFYSPAATASQHIQPPIPVHITDGWRQGIRPQVPSRGQTGLAFCEYRLPVIDSSIPGIKEVVDRH